MKKLMSALLALIMVTALCLSAGAADSISGIVEVDLPEETVISSVSAEKIVTMEEIMDEVVAFFNSDSDTAAELKAALEELGVEIEDLMILDEVQIGGDVSEENPCETKITVNGMPAGTPIVVLFLADAEDAEWEVLAVGTAPSVDVKFTAPGMIVIAIA